MDHLINHRESRRLLTIRLAAVALIAGALGLATNALPARADDVIVGSGNLLFDMDGDGLFDNDETAIYGTNPNIPDTDGDGVWDGEEVFRGTNPLAADVPIQPLGPGDEIVGNGNIVADSDMDGLYDVDETDVYGTDPRNPDTDGDGLDDGQEVYDGTNPLVAGA